MIQFPQDLLNSKWDALSPEIREILLSDAFDTNIETIISNLGLTEFADNIINLCTYAVYGLVDQNGFFKELTDLIGPQKSPDLAKKLIIEVIIPTVTIKHETKTEIKVEPPTPVVPQVAEPPKEAVVEHPMPIIQEQPPVIPVPAEMTAPIIANEPTPILAPVITPETSAPTIAQAPDPTPAKITPDFNEEPAKIEPAETPSAASPFIIHVEKENLESVSETKSSLNLSPVRPIFYEEKETDGDSIPKATFVKLQFAAPTTNQKIGDKLKESKDISLKDLPVQ